MYSYGSKTIYVYVLSFLSAAFAAGPLAGHARGLIFEMLKTLRQHKII